MVSDDHTLNQIMFNAFNCLWSFIHSVLRSIYKGILHRITKLCELQRICYNIQNTLASRTLLVETSLKKSKLQDLQSILKHDMESVSVQSRLENALKIVLSRKNINPLLQPEFVKSFARCLLSVWYYERLTERVKSLTQVSYDKENTDHEEKLLKLWSFLMPNSTLSGRISKQWQYIGFQGDDPGTDFRGMGILGLWNLLYFAENFPISARKILLHSQKGNGFDFAIVGINLTHMTFMLCDDGSAKSHFYNSANWEELNGKTDVINQFHRLYCYIFLKFYHYWISSQPENIMDFARVRSQFEKNIRAMLSHSSVSFSIMDED